MCSKICRMLTFMTLLLMLTGCAAQSFGEAKLLTDGVTQTGSGEKYAVVTRGTLDKEFTVPADVSYVRKTVVRLEAEQAQYVETCVSNGQTVQAGETLAVFSSAGDEVRLLAIEQELEMLELDTQDALADLEKQREELLELHEEVEGENGYSGYRDRVTAQVLDQKLEKLEMQRQQILLRAQEEERLLNQEKQELNREKAECIVTAPVDGVVGQVQYFRAGEECTRGQAVVMLYDPDEYLLIAGDGLMGTLRVGQSVQVEYGRQNDRKMAAGTVVAADNALPADLKNGQAAVRVLDDVDPETLVSVKIHALQMNAEKLLILPRDAVRYESGKAYVELLVDGAPTKRYVQTGPGDGENISVISGLEEGWKAVLN